MRRARTRFLVIGIRYALGIGAIVGATAAAPAPPASLPKLSPDAGVSYDVRDAKTGKPIPCKLTFVGVDGTRDPEFTRVDIARQEGEGAIAAFNRVMSLTGVGVARVPLGTYDVTVSRGPEWEISTTKKLKLTARGRRSRRASRTWSTRPGGCRPTFTSTPRAPRTRASRCRIASTSSSPTTSR